MWLECVFCGSIMYEASARRLYDTLIDIFISTNDSLELTFQILLEHNGNEDIEKKKQILSEHFIEKLKDSTISVKWGNITYLNYAIGKWLQMHERFY